MAIKSGDYLGLWIPAVGQQFEMYAQNFGGSKLFVSQKATEGGETGYVIRGRELVSAASNGFQKSGNFTEADLEALEATNKTEDPYGLKAPASFTTPNGWVKRLSKDGVTEYYVNLVDTNLDGTPDASQSGVTAWGSKALDFAKQYWHYILVAAIFIYLLWASSLPKKRRKKASFGLL